MEDLINAESSSLPSRFDQLLITDIDGNVIYRSSTQNIQHKKHLGRFEYDPFRYGFIGFQTLNKVLNTVNFSRPLSSQLGDAAIELIKQNKNFQGISNNFSHHVGGMNFRFFVQPMHMPVTYCTAIQDEDPNLKDLNNVNKNTELNTKKVDRKQGIVETLSAQNQKKAWLLIGIINEKRFKQSALAAPPIFVGTAILAIVIVLSFLPFLKTALADNHLQFSKQLRSLVLCCNLICCMFIVLLICFLLSHVYLIKKNSDEINNKHRHLQRAFEDELQIKIQLLEENNKLFTDDMIYSKKPNIFTKIEHLNQDKYLRNTPAYTHNLENFLSNDMHSKSFYNFFMLDAEGKPSSLVNSIKQIIPSSDASFKERTYFQKAFNDNLWSITKKDGSKYQLFIERIISFLDGQYETIFSTKSGTDQVAILNSRFDSLFQPILPAHFSFAVIDNNNGRVLYHSTPERALVESFIDETDGDPALIAKLYHQTEGYINLTYQGQPVQAFISPLLKTSDNQAIWSLVTFKVVDLDRNMVLITTLTTALLLLILTLLAYIISVLIDLFFRNNLRIKVKGWLQKPRVYYLLYFLVIVITICCFVSLFSSFSDSISKYDKKYQEQEKIQRKAAFKTIFQTLHKVIRTKENNSEYENGKTYIESMMVEPQTGTEISQTTNQGITTLTFPSISYPTGVLFENHNKELFIMVVVENIYLVTLILILLCAPIIIIKKITREVIDKFFRKFNFNDIDIDEIADHNLIKLLNQKPHYQILIRSNKNAFEKLVNQIESQDQKPVIVRINSLDSLNQTHRCYPKNSILCIDDLPYFLLEKQNRDTLYYLLETFQSQQSSILIASDIVPDYWLSILEEYKEFSMSGESDNHAMIYNWGVILGKFQFNILKASSINSKVNPAEKTLDTITWHKQWTLSTFQEKNILYSLAKKSLILNPISITAIESLYIRGLIKFDKKQPGAVYSELILDNQNFARFINHPNRENYIKEWHNRVHETGWWFAIMPTIMVTIALLMIFLLTTGREALQYSMAVIASMATAIPLVSTVFETFKKR